MDKTILMRKTNKVFARLGFEDLIVPLEDSEKIFSSTETYLVGYEDEEGEECEEDGMYLDQRIDPNQIKMFKD
tara:strand:- start:1180 stop:1398 length:219 start_codon:yes stop_codon:yes gene_type:complete